MRLNKPLQRFLILLLVFTWLLASWPPVWPNPRFPPGIREGIAAAPGGAWWSMNYKYRQKITVTAGLTAVPTAYTVPVTFNHASLVTAGKSQADGDDIRILYWNGSAWVELDRVLDMEAGASWNSASTKIWFKTQAAISASGSDDNYYLYYGNSTAASPPANAENVYIAFKNFATDPGVACTDYNANAFAEICRFGFTFPSATAYRIWEKYKIEARHTSPTGFGVAPIHLNRVGGTGYPNFYHGGCNDTDCVPAAQLPAVRANLGAWYTVTVGTTYDRLFIRNETSLKLYLDGVLRSSSTAGDSTAYEDYTIQLYDGGGRAGVVEYNAVNQRLRIYDLRTDTDIYIDYWIDDVRLGKYVDPEPTTAQSAEEELSFNQSAYRFFNNTDTTDVGTVLAAQDTAATLGSTGAAFRLRMLLHITGGLPASGQNFKLQFAQQSGTCDTGFVGETYADVTAATVIAYNNNATPADGATLTANANDPTHGADTIVNQDYEELNNFTNSVAAIPAGQDGKWDFALIDNGATADTAYCLRTVKSDATVLDTYTVIPQITTAAGGPTLEQLMWHGKFFSGGAEQPMQK